MVEEFGGLWMMAFANLLAVLVQLVLWVAVAVVGMRLHPRAQMLLLSAGIIGALEALVLPVISVVARQMATSSLGVGAFYLVNALLTTLGTLLLLFPWVLLLVGLVRLGSLRYAEEGES